MIHKSFLDAEKFEGPTNVTYEYNIEDKDINYCIVNINGRFPLQGYAINKVCKEMAHILQGSGYIWVDGIRTELKEDDVVLIMPNEKYYWEGNFRLGIPCAPAWYPEQHITVDE